jgi:glycosyltransferase involved in cell wall biosynthesis
MGTGPQVGRSIAEFSRVSVGEHALQAGLTVIIPAFNEASGLAGVLQSLKALSNVMVREIIVIDDGSSDETAVIAEAAGVRLIRHHRNLGYGASLKTGIRAARTKYMLTMDADGQHRADDVVRLWERVDDHDMVIGQRTNLIHSPLWRMPGKWLLGLMAQYLTRARIPDLNSGFRILRKDVASKYLHLCPRGFSFSTTMTMALLSRGYDVTFVPIELQKRVGKSTVSISTGFETLVLLIRISALFDPLRIFIPASLGIGVAGIVWGLPYAFSGRGISVGAMLAIVTAVVLFALGLLSDQISQSRLERYE